MKVYINIGKERIEALAWDDCDIGLVIYAPSVPCNFVLGAGNVEVDEMCNIVLRYESSSVIVVIGLITTSRVS